MSGEIKCRIYNDYAAEFSDPANITVLSKYYRFFSQYFQLGMPLRESVDCKLIEKYTNNINISSNYGETKVEN